MNYSDKNRTYAIRLIEESAAQKSEILFEKIDFKNKEGKINKMYFDIVSLQFCAHYMFDKEENARNLFKNMTQRLLKNGYIIMTFPDANVLVRKIREKGVKGSDGGYV